VTLYVEPSALLKRYVAESDSLDAEAILRSDPDWVSARHSYVEVRRNLTRVLKGNALTAARGSFGLDWERMNVIELDAAVCSSAAGIAEATQVRTLDALHLAAAQKVGGAIATFDGRLAEAARSMGMRVLGV